MGGGMIREERIWGHEERDEGGGTPDYLLMDILFPWDLGGKFILFRQEHLLRKVCTYLYCTLISNYVHSTVHLCSRFLAYQAD